MVWAAREARPEPVEDSLGASLADDRTRVVIGTIDDVPIGYAAVHVEVLHDLAYRVAPINHAQAQAMLQELRGYKLLEGTRGAAPRDIDALCDLIVRLSWLGHDCADAIAELDINPVMLYAKGEGARVVDALIVKHGADVSNQSKRN